MKVLNYTLIATIVLLVGLSGYSLASPYFFKTSAITVDFIKEKAQCGPLKIGDRIISVESRIIKNSDDFSIAVASVKSGDYIAMTVNGGPGSCKAIDDGDLGFTVKESISEGIKSGSDISKTKSFTYSLLNSNSTSLSKAKKIINDRINFFDLPQTRVEVTDDKIKITTPFDNDLPYLVYRGKLLATIFENFQLDQGAAKVIVENNAYILRPKNDTISINGTDVPADKTFELSNVTFRFVNMSGPSINLEAELYGNEDVIVNPTSQIIVSPEPKINAYFYYIPVSVAPEVNEKLTNIIKKAESVFIPGGGTILNARLNYYLDDQIVSSLSIPVELIGNQISAISGIEKTSSEAYDVGRKIFVTLRFGALPADLVLESQSFSEPTIDKLVSYGTVGTGFVFFVIILAYTYYKTKNAKVALWTFTLVLLELFISVGLLIAANKYFEFRLLIDFPVLIGLVFITTYSSLTFFVYFEGLQGRHKHITIRYKKIISLMNLLRIILLGTMIVGIIGYRGMAFVLLVGFLVDSLLIKEFFKTLMTGKT